MSFCNIDETKDGSEILENNEKKLLAIGKEIKNTLVEI
jgi:hypothetical protein